MYPASILACRQANTERCVDRGSELLWTGQWDLPSVYPEDPPDAPTQGCEGFLESLGGGEAHHHL